MDTRHIDFKWEHGETTEKEIPLQIGHIHLSVADLTGADQYCDAFDLRVTQRDYPGAIFMALRKRSPPSLD